MSGAGAANDGGGGGEPARKRIRLESGAGGVLSTTTPTTPPTITNGNTAENRELAEMVRAKIAEVTTKASHSREREVGILKWVNEKNTGFEGVLKQRYVRFMLISI
jgi:tRNA pseudouridine13 synthase